MPGNTHTHPWLKVFSGQKKKKKPQQNRTKSNTPLLAQQHWLLLAYCYAVMCSSSSPRLPQKPINTTTSILILIKVCRRSCVWSWIRFQVELRVWVTSNIQARGQAQIRTDTSWTQDSELTKNNLNSRNFHHQPQLPYHNFLWQQFNFTTQLWAVPGLLPMCQMLQFTMPGHSRKFVRWKSL